MATVNLKIKAVCLILLLAGQEANRIQGNSLVMDIQSSIKPDDPWNEADNACTWNLFHGGCTGDGCQFRPLVLDKSLSESCRLSDTSMLNPTGLDIAAQVFEDKSKKFQNDCIDAKPWEVSKQLRCQRRAGRMLRSTQLLSKAVQAQEPISPENTKRVEQALNNIGSAFGTDGQHILELKDKLKGDLLNFAKDPTGKIKTIIQTVSTLLAGSESDKEEAKQVIRDMPSSSLTNMTEQDKKEIEEVTTSLVQENDLLDPEVTKEAFANLDNLVPSGPNDTEVSSSLETEEASALIETEDVSNSSSRFVPFLGLLNPFRGGRRRRKGGILPSHVSLFFNLIVAIVVLAIILVLIGSNAANLGALVAILSGAGTIFLAVLVILTIVDTCRFVAWLASTKKKGNTTTPPPSNKPVTTTPFGVAAPFTTTGVPGVLPPGAKFDPLTGKPLNNLPPGAKFDPMTGEPLEPKRPKSPKGRGRGKPGRKSSDGRERKRRSRAQTYP